MEVGGVRFAGEFVCSREFAEVCETWGSVGCEEVVKLDILFCFCFRRNMENKGKMDEREYKASLLFPYFNTIPIGKVKDNQYRQPMLQRYISRKK